MIKCTCVEQDVKIIFYSEGIKGSFAAVGLNSSSCGLLINMVSLTWFETRGQNVESNQSSSKHQVQMQSASFYFDREALLARGL